MRGGERETHVGRERERGRWTELEGDEEWEGGRKQWGRERWK